MISIKVKLTMYHRKNTQELPCLTFWCVYVERLRSRCMLLGKSYELVIFFFVHFQPSLNFDFGIVTDLSACECRFTQSILISFYMCI